MIAKVGKGLVFRDWVKGNGFRIQGLGLRLWDCEVGISEKKPNPKPQTSLFIRGKKPEVRSSGPKGPSSVRNRQVCPYGGPIPWLFFISKS